MKCGLSGEDAPQVVFASCVGYPKGEMLQGPNKDHYVGEEAMLKRGILNLKYPIEHRRIQNWDDMEKVWRHTFNELRVVVGADEEADEDVCGVVMTESVSSQYGPKQPREQMTQTMFETFQTRRFYLSSQPVLALYASGRTTGVVCDCGDGASHVVPIHEGHTLPDAIGEMNQGGQDLTNYLCTTLTAETDKMYTTSGERETVKGMKETLCRVSLNFEEEVDNYEGKERHLELPDGSMLMVYNQAIRCPELMFKPSLQVHWQGGNACEPSLGLHHLTKKTIDDCDVDIHKDLLNNIVMAGGNTMFENMPERMQAEMERLVQQDTKVKVIAPPERAISVWIGGSILAELSDFQASWITKQDYEDAGPTIVHQMCSGNGIIAMK